MPLGVIEEVAYLGLSDGEPGFLPMADLANIPGVVHTFRLVTCRDPVVNDLARAAMLTELRNGVVAVRSWCSGLMTTHQGNLSASLGQKVVNLTNKKNIINIMFLNNKVKFFIHFNFNNFWYRL